MRVKIDNTTYDSEDQPIMLILSEEDKDLISRMHPCQFKYCCFSQNYEGDSKSILEFMET